MTNKRLVMNESYKHWRKEMHHSWPIFKFKILLLTYKIPVTIIVTGILWWCHWYNYCTSDITTLVPQREKLMLHLLRPTCHQRFFPFFYFAGHQGQWWAGMFFKDLPLRVVEKIFCIFPSTCMFDWIHLISSPCTSYISRRGIQVVYDYYNWLMDHKCYKKEGCGCAWAVTSWGLHESASS